MHFHKVDFGGKTLARSLKKLWTDEKLVYLCSAKDKMVSNLTTILLYCFSFKCPYDRFFSVCCQFGGATLQFVTFKCVYILGGGVYLNWVKFVIWSCLAGYRPSYFVLEGGKGVGRSIRESQAPQLCRSAPRALAEDWWSGRAQSCLPDPSVWFNQCLSTFPTVLFRTYTSIFGSTWWILSSWLSLQISAAFELLTEHMDLRAVILTCLKVAQMVSGRQLTICTPPPASDAGLERQKHAQQRWPLYFRAVEASRYK